MVARIGSNTDLWRTFIDRFLVTDATLGQWLREMLRKSQYYAAARQLFSLEGPSHRVESLLLLALMESGL